jgi:glycyl-tRNA synthetase beta chain
MSEFLLEVGCEELPASFVEKAVLDLAKSLVKSFDELGLAHSDPVTFATPRRLIVSFNEVQARQEDSQKEQRGPSVKAAFNEAGEPLPALIGFCKSQGIDVKDLRNDGQYVWVTKHISGRTSDAILNEILPELILGLTFEKSMRWGISRAKFARPIRWILATMGGKSLNFSVENVHSGIESRGHRFYAPESFEASSLDQLITRLRQRRVEPDASIRRQAILDQTHKIAPGKAQISEELLEENTYLCEWPTAIVGSFPESFLELPDPVLVTAMAKHERMFPVRDENGKLTRNFVFIRNSGEDDTVRRGTEWVLGARFNDAKFFYEADKTLTLEDFLAKTEGVVFQAQLGTVRQRISRLEGLAENVALMTGASDDEVQLARSTARLAKVDLATGLVSELSSLQGIIGGEYARREGQPEAVSIAISHQYDLKNLDATTVEGRTAIRFVIADQLDKLAGYLGLGLEPTGSSDPFGLRRAVTILIDCAERWTGHVPAYDQLLEQALAEYLKQNFQLAEAGAYAAICDIFAGRYPALFTQYRRDILDAAMMKEMRWELTMPRNVRFRSELLTKLVSDETLVQTATRPMNIVAAARKKKVDYAWEDPLAKTDPSKLESAEGVALHKMLKQQEDEIFVTAREENSARLEQLVRGLIPLINAFFENTMVMADDEVVRYHRLSLAHATSLQLLAAGDFTKITH